MQYEDDYPELDNTPDFSQNYNESFNIDDSDFNINSSGFSFTDNSGTSINTDFSFN